MSLLLTWIIDLSNLHLPAVSGFLQCRSLWALEEYSRMGRWCIGGFFLELRFLLTSAQPTCFSSCSRQSAGGELMGSMLHWPAPTTGARLGTVFKGCRAGSPIQWFSDSTFFNKIGFTVPCNYNRKWMNEHEFLKYILNIYWKCLKCLFSPSHSWLLALLPLLPHTLLHHQG